MSQNQDVDLEQGLWEAQADNLDEIVRRLRQERLRWREAHPRNDKSGGRSLPSRQAIERIVTDLCGVLFPMRLGPGELSRTDEDFYIGHTLGAALNELLIQCRLELGNRAQTDPQSVDSQARLGLREFAESLPNMRALLDTDVEAAFLGDPAARSVDEVLLCYPGVLAVIHYRLAHRLWQLGFRLIPRIVTEIAHALTGIDIHPGATIGGSFFIDHGTGVVIGETAIIGERVRLYQAVTLGAKSFPADPDGLLRKGLPRHPIVEDDVVIYAGATILGRVTVGRGSVIGGNVWLTESVPAGSLISLGPQRASALGGELKAGEAPNWNLPNSQQDVVPRSP